MEQVLFIHHHHTSSFALAFSSCSLEGGDLRQRRRGTMEVRVDAFKQQPQLASSMYQPSLGFFRLADSLTWFLSYERLTHRIDMQAWPVHYLGVRTADHCLPLPPTHLKLQSLTQPLVMHQKHSESIRALSKMHFLKC